MRPLKTLLLLIVIISLGAWPDINIGNLKNRLIDSTGIVSSNQVDALLKAGGKLNAASKTLTDEQEYHLGRGVSALILKHYPLYSADIELTKYVATVGHVLAARSPRPEIFGGYHFAIIDTDQINALSAPGGFIYVSRALLELMPSEDALAGVLAHEIGHIVLGHGVKAISKARVNEAMMIIGKEAAAEYGPSELTAVTDVFGDSVSKVFDSLVKSGYSRSQEYDADEFAAKLLVKAGYSATGLKVMLDRINTVQGKARGGWMDTHPSPSDRKASLHLPKQAPDPAGLEARTARFKAVANP
ncbi:MAG: M48 family metalloprotease [Deltaproteobacteria bacterium]|nr:M48 family metalloprotease [Deltaproteobacteria bacterium]